MSLFFLLLLLFILAIFGCVSVSQSYASARQAQAVIETNHTAQLALRGQIAANIIFALVALILLIVLLVLVYLLVKKAPSPQTTPVQEKLSTTQLRLPVSWDEDEKELSDIISGWGWSGGDTP